jgi:holin-like protein
MRSGTSLAPFGGVLLAVCLGLLGTAIAEASGLALPGAVIGLVALAVLLHVAPALEGGTGAAFDRAAPHMILLFVPAGSGVLARAADLSGDWLAVGGAILLGTPLTIAVVALAAQALFARGAQGPEAAR